MRTTRWRPGQIKFTPERCDRIVGLLGEGNYPDVVAKAVGVNPKTVRRWTARGRTEDDRIEAGGEPDPDEAAYRDFAVNYDRSIAQSEIDLLRQCRKEPAGQWQRSMTIMSRRFRDRW